MTINQRLDEHNTVLLCLLWLALVVANLSFLSVAACCLDGCMCMILLAITALTALAALTHSLLVVLSLLVSHAAGLGTSRSMNNRQKFWCHCLRLALLGSGTPYCSRCLTNGGCVLVSDTSSTSKCRTLVCMALNDSNSMLACVEKKWGPLGQAVCSTGEILTRLSTIGRGHFWEGRRVLCLSSFTQKSQAIFDHHKSQN